MPDELVDVLVDFARVLRADGLAVGSGDVIAYTSAAAVLDPTDLLDLYWAGRTSLVIRREDVATYDAAFRRFFLGGPAPAAERLVLKPRTVRTVEAVLTLPETEPQEPGREDEVRVGLRASDAATLKHKSFAACTPEELAALRRIMRRIRLMPPRRRTRRTVAARSGRMPDVRRTVRSSMRMHGEPVALLWRRRRLRVRPLVLILDVSGSMADYSRSLLQFAYSARRAAVRVEVFCFGTRLTRITRELTRRQPDAALTDAAAAVFDWDGGTHIGKSLDAFVRNFARRGLSRGAVVVICSDGLDRGEPAVLSKAMEQLSRLSHRIVWVNPHGAAGAVGMRAAEPYIDLVLSGHDLSSLAELAAELPRLG
ncbi:MAG TPA: VWA domain-containing protein [Jatrophihabitans sp.]|nr:VWA domain-containing protein [Jatrophihabitans sp.]